MTRGGNGRVVHTHVDGGCLLPLLFGIRRYIQTGVSWGPGFARVR